MARMTSVARVRSPKRNLSRVAERQTMPVILRDVPAGYHWGWYSREEPRMHLQTVGRPRRNQYKVWLERHGQRVFEPVEKIPATVLKRLEAELQRSRMTIEDHWVELMIEARWLECHVTLPHVTLVAYPGTPNRFARRIDLGSYFTDTALASLRRETVRLDREMVSVQLWTDRPEPSRHDIRISRILWMD